MLVPNGECIIQSVMHQIAWFRIIILEVEHHPALFEPPYFGA
jgi:hypothetical protein